MKLIIEIPKELFDKCKQWSKHGVASSTEQLVANGTPVYDHERLKGEWIDYDNTFYKCPECGYLLEKCCPQCQNKVILPKGGAK